MYVWLCVHVSESILFIIDALCLCVSAVTHIWGVFHQAFSQWFSLTKFISYWNPCIWLAEGKLVSEKHWQKAWWNAPLFTDSLSCTFCPPQWLRCKGKIDFSTVKTPRHYFLHVTNCNGHRETTGIWNLQYKVHLTNGQGPFVHEFSFDQRCKSITYNLTIIIL